MPVHQGAASTRSPLSQEATGAANSYLTKVQGNMRQLVSDAKRVMAGEANIGLVVIQLNYIVQNAWHICLNPILEKVFFFLFSFSFFSFFLFSFFSFFLFFFFSFF